MLLAESVTISGEALLLGMVLLVVAVVVAATVAGALTYVGAMLGRSQGGSVPDDGRRPIGMPALVVGTLAALVTAVVFIPAAPVVAFGCGVAAGWYRATKQP